MARHWFGGTTNDMVVRKWNFGQGNNLLALAPGHVVTFWDAEVGGNRLLDLLLGGVAVQEIVADGQGYLPRYQGPDLAITMWADMGDGSPRRLAITTDAAVDLSNQVGLAVDAAADAEASAGAAASSAAQANLAAQDYTSTVDNGDGTWTIGSNLATENGDGTFTLGPAAASLNLYSKTGADGRFARKPWVDARDYGYVGNGVADDTAALNAAAAAANGTDKLLYIPRGTGNAKITGTVTINCELFAREVTLSYTGTGTALVIGDESAPGIVTSRRTMSLPRVVKPTQDWDGSSVGVRLVNLNACNLHIPFVQNFEEGLVVYGYSQGIAYCTITLGALWQNHRNLILDCDATGWSNQNTFIGGRLQQTITGGATNDDASANQILIGRTSGSAPNQNLFLNTSVEGDNPAFYRLDCNGRYNRFVNCRWESMSAESRVRWGASAQDNVIEGGYDADQLVETVVAGALRNTIRDRLGAYIKASNTSGQAIPTGASFTTLTGWTNDSRRAPYTTGNGAWTPAAGRWRITATVTFTGSASGTKRQARFLVGGATVLDNAQIPSGTVPQTMKLQADHHFDGATSLVVQASHDVGANLSLVTTDAFVTLNAERIS